MTQTRTSSLAESCTNIGIGFTINWTANVLILPVLWNPNSPKLSAFYIGCAFTIISFCRSYCLRRFYNSRKWGNK